MSKNTESRRLAALEQLGILDTPEEEIFNDIVELASRLCNSPISLITLLDENRQWFKAAKGTHLQETERSFAFCSYAILQNDLFMVPDATIDSRFADNPLVTGDPNIRFYAGSQIMSPDGYKLGTLCVIDNKARELSWQEADSLRKLSRQASNLIELQQLKKSIHQSEEAADAQKVVISESQRDYSELVQLNQALNQQVAHFFENGLDALRTGKFTKKDLAQIASTAQNYLNQLATYNETLSLLANIKLRKDELKREDVNMAVLTAAVLDELGHQTKVASLKFIPFVAADLIINHHKPALHLILKTLLGILASNVKKTEINLFFQAKELGIEINIAVPQHNLVASLSQVEDQKENSSIPDPSQILFTEIPVIQSVITSLKGKMNVQQLGNNGTSMSIWLPSLSQKAQ